MYFIVLLLQFYNLFMKILETYNLIRLLIINPSEFWKGSFTSINAKYPLYKGFVMILFLAVVVSNLLGETLAMLSNSQSFILILTKVSILYLSLHLSLFISLIAVKEIFTGIYKNQSSKEISYLIVYSISIYWVSLIITGILSNYGTLSNFIEFLSLYGVYVFYVGSKQLINSSRKKILAFTIISTISVVFVHWLVYWSTGFIVEIVKYMTIS